MIGVFVLSLGSATLGWTPPSGVAPELGLVFPTSFGADHRGHEVLSTRSKEATKRQHHQEQLVGGWATRILPAQDGTGLGATTGQARQQQGTSGPGS